MAVVGQFAGIETVAEHTFARGCNPERTVAVESDICHHLDFFAFFAVLEQLLAFPVGRVEEADSVLGGYHQVVLVRRDVADDVGRQGLRITCFHAVVCESPRAYVQSVQSAQMGSYPDNVFGGIIIESLDIVMGNTVGTDSRAEPFEFTSTAVVIVQSAPFGANPQIAVLVFDGAAYNRIAQPLLFDGRIHIAAVYLVLGVEVVDAAKVGPQPQRSLVVLYDAPDGRVCQSVALGITGSVVLEESRTFVIPVQSVECPNPDVSQIVFTAGSHEVGRDAVRVLCVVFKDFDGSVGLYMVQPFFPAANP